MANILVYIELRHEQITDPSLRVLALGRKLATSLGATLGAVLPCSQAPQYGEDDHVALLSRYGADKVVLIVDPRFAGPPSFATHGGALLAACQRYPPSLLLVPATAAGRDIAARVAQRLEMRLTPDVARAQLNPRGDLELVQSVHGGRLARRVLVGSRATVATVLPWMHAGPVGDDEAEVIVVPAPDADLRVLIEAVRPDAAPHGLSEARVVVTGGAGVGSADAFSVLGELATLLGGVLAATPTACERGLAPPELCITRPTERPAPELYFSFGASGSVEHLRALRGSPVIVAVDRERSAPIFKVARYGIVGDALSVARDLVASLRARPERAPRRPSPVARTAADGSLADAPFVEHRSTLPPGPPAATSSEEHSS